MTALSQVDRDTILAKGTQQAIAAITNAQLVGKATHVRAVGNPLRNTVCVVVGAGPSLDEAALTLLHDHAHHVLVCSTNTSLGALAKARIGSDLVCVAESIDLTAHITDAGRAYWADRLLLDLGCAPALFARAASPLVYHGPSAETRLFTHVLGLPPLPNAGSALTGACAALAAMGAKSIVLMGADFGFRDGPVYADGAAWAELQCHAQGDRLAFEGAPERDAAHAAAGVPGVPRNRPVVEKTGSMGGTVYTTADYLSQWEWLVHWHSPCPVARLAGPCSVTAPTLDTSWDDIAHLLADSQLWDPSDLEQPLGDAAARKLTAEVQATAEALRVMAEQVLSGERLSDPGRSLSCVDALCQPAMVLLAEQRETPIGVRRRALWEHRLTTAKAILAASVLGSQT